MCFVDVQEYGLTVFGKTLMLNLRIFVKDFTPLHAGDHRKGMWENNNCIFQTLYYEITNENVCIKHAS